MFYIISSLFHILQLDYLLNVSHKECSSILRIKVINYLNYYNELQVQTHITKRSSFSYHISQTTLFRQRKKPYFSSIPVSVGVWHAKSGCYNGCSYCLRLIHTSHSLRSGNLVRFCNLVLLTFYYCYCFLLNGIFFRFFSQLLFSFQILEFMLL